MKKHPLRPLGLLLLLLSVRGFCQVPFPRTGQVFMTFQFANELAEFSVLPGANTIDYQIIGSPTVPGIVSAIGFRKTDNLIYGISTFGNELHRIGQNGNATSLGQVGLTPSLFYGAGDVSPDGKFFYSIGSDFLGGDVHLAQTNLENGTFTTVLKNITVATNIRDIAFDPISGNLFGYDAKNHQMLTINPQTGSLSTFQPLKAEHEVSGLYFDAFGDLYAVGTAAYGIVSGHFSINKNTGAEKLLATGFSFTVGDLASCPFSVEVKNSVDPQKALSCSDLTYKFQFANGGGETLTGLDFEHKLPPGFFFKEIPANPLSVAFDTSSTPGTLLLKNFPLSPGQTEFAIKISTADVAKGVYKSQATLKNLPPVYGSALVSDNPNSAGFGDQTFVEITRFDEDSLFFEWLICHGDTLQLSAEEYGNSIVWNTGGSSKAITVKTGGLFSLEAKTNCQSLFVAHDVVSASCPFTIELFNSFFPDSIFACNVDTARFFIENDSGEKRPGISFSNTLPPGMTFLEILNNPFGGNLKTPLPSGNILIEDMTMPIGKAALDILIEIGNIAPGTYFNRAQIFNIHPLMGPNRISDDPDTFPFDSTSLTILGANSDSLFFADTICRGETLVLDASKLAVDFLWDDGSTSATRKIGLPGIYELDIFDGCEPGKVFYEISEGSRVEISGEDSVFIHQSEVATLSTIVLNEGNTLELGWVSTGGDFLGSCQNCPSTKVQPLEDTEYQLIANNEICADSFSVRVFVDRSRRVFAPTVFSPNGDGFNDHFSLQSPDPGEILELSVFDRWGNLVFSSGGAIFNVEQSGWDGKNSGRLPMPGVYVWIAEIEFLDGEKRTFSGNVSIVK